MTERVKFYHGGRPGMKTGQFILAPAVTGTSKTLANYGAEGLCRRDRVYVTTDHVAAAMYAGMYSTKKAGWVYEVEPVGEVEPDPDCSQPGLSFSAEKARIIKVYRLGPAGVRKIREAVTYG